MQPKEAVQPGEAVGLEPEWVQPGLAVQPRKAVACSAVQSAARFGCAAWIGCWRDGSETSSYQSVERGADSIETDFLNGEIVLLGRLHGVSTGFFLHALVCPARMSYCGVWV